MEPGQSDKKTRKRHKNLCRQIKMQMEFYFSDANLLKDRFVKKLMDESEDKWISLEVFKKFNKLSKLTTDMTLVAKAISTSDLIEVNESRDKIRRTKPIADPGDLDARTIYVENLPASVDHDWVRNVFSDHGTVTYVSLPKFRSTGDFKGFAFVEYQDEEEAKRAVREYISSVSADSSKRPGMFPVGSKQMKQVTKQAIAHNITVPLNTPLDNDENSTQESANKRARSEGEADSGDDTVAKKQKTEDDSDGDDSSEEEQEVQEKGKKRKNEEDTENSSRKKQKKEEAEKNTKEGKKKRKKKNKKTTEDEPQLRVVSKAEWLSLRKEYLEMQKSNMAKLKESLKKVAIQNQAPTKKEAMDTSTTGVNNADKGKKTLEFTADVVFEVTSELPMARKTLKEALSAHGDVTYIDLVDGECRAVVRCPSPDSAASITAATISSYTSRRLKGDEEKQYWDKIVADREKRLGSKSHKKARGKDKVIGKAHQSIVDSQKRKHVLFDDS